MANLVYQLYVQASNQYHGGLSKDTMTACINSVKHYAKRHNCDYVFQSDINELRDSIIGRQCPSKIRNTMLECVYYRLNLIYDERYDEYDDILYADTDLLIDPEAPSLFGTDLGRDNYTDIMAVNESTLGVRGCEHAPRINRLFNHFDTELARSKTKDREFRYINGGFIVYTKKGRLKARERWEDWRDWMIWAALHDDPTMKNTMKLKGVLSDQPYMNAMMAKYNFNVLELEEKWNYIISESKWPVFKESQYVYHFPNERKQRIAEFLKMKKWEFFYK